MPGLVDASGLLTSLGGQLGAGHLGAVLGGAGLVGHLCNGLKKGAVGVGCGRVRGNCY